MEMDSTSNRLDFVQVSCACRFTVSNFHGSVLSQDFVEVQKFCYSFVVKVLINEFLTTLPRMISSFPILAEKGGNSNEEGWCKRPDYDDTLFGGFVHHSFCFGRPHLVRNSKHVCYDHTSGKHVPFGKKYELFEYTYDGTCLGLFIKAFLEIMNQPIYFFFLPSILHFFLFIKVVESFQAGFDVEQLELQR